MATTAEVSERLWDVKQTASYLGVSTASVTRLTKKGVLPCFYVGALVRYSPAEVRQYLAGTRVG